MKLRLLMVAIIFYSAALFGAQPAATTAAAAAANEPEKVVVVRSAEVKKKAPKREPELEKTTGLPKELASIVGEYVDFKIDVNDPALKKLWYSEINVREKLVKNINLSPNREYAILCTEHYVPIGLPSWLDTTKVYIYRYENGAWREITSYEISRGRDYYLSATAMICIPTLTYEVFIFDQTKKKWIKKRINDQRATMSGNGTIFELLNKDVLTVTSPSGGTTTYNIRISQYKPFSFDGEYITNGARLVRLKGNSQYDTYDIPVSGYLNISVDNNYIIVVGVDGENGEHKSVYKIYRWDSMANKWNLVKDRLPQLGLKAAFTVDGDIVTNENNIVTFYRQRDMWESAQEANIDFVTNDIDYNSVGDIIVSDSREKDKKAGYSTVRIVLSSVLRDILDLTMDQVVFLRTIYARQEANLKTTIALTNDEIKQFTGLPETVQERVIEVYGLPVGKPKTQPATTAATAAK